MATRLHQIIAIWKGVQSRAHAELTRYHRDLQTPALLSGMNRTYTPKIDGGDIYPSESTQVQLRARDAINEVQKLLTRVLDVAATKEDANARAKADVILDGDVLLHDVPVTYLLFLEHQLVDLRTFVGKLPTLDPAEEWHHDGTTGTYATDATQTFRTKKVPRNHVLAEATKEHPAQVQVYFEDVPEGTWTLVKHSGALPVTLVRELLARVEKVAEAVKVARETANAVEVADKEVGAALLGYIFAPVL